VLAHSAAGIYNSLDQTADIIRSHAAVSKRKLNMPASQVAVQVVGSSDLFMSQANDIA
jgi:hypothetical protein